MAQKQLLFKPTVTVGVYFWEHSDKQTEERISQQTKPNKVGWGSSVQYSYLFLFDRWISVIKRLVQNQMLYILWQNAKYPKNLKINLQI